MIPGRTTVREVTISAIIIPRVGETRRGNRFQALTFYSSSNVSNNEHKKKKRKRERERESEREKEREREKVR